MEKLACLIPRDQCVNFNFSANIIYMIKSPNILLANKSKIKSKIDLQTRININFISK